MNAPREVSVAARPWPVQAVEDLATVRRLVDDGESPPRLAAFLAHLAAEKALKARSSRAASRPARFMTWSSCCRRSSRTTQ